MIAKLGDDVSMGKTYEQWLAAQPEADQRKVLGDARFRIFGQGTAWTALWIPTLEKRSPWQSCAG